MPATLADSIKRPVTVGTAQAGSTHDLSCSAGVGQASVGAGSLRSHPRDAERSGWTASRPLDCVDGVTSGQVTLRYQYQPAIFRKSPHARSASRHPPMSERLTTPTAARPAGGRSPLTGESTV